MEKNILFIETYTLKNQDCFAIFDAFGNINVELNPEEGIYYKGTRFLSKFKFKIFDKCPILLSASVKEDNTLFTSDLTNPDLFHQDKLLIPKGSIHIFRSRFLYENCCYEKFVVRNFHLSPVELTISFHFGSDFVDIFEVRGFKRKKRGSLLPPQREKNKLRLGYEGLDGKKRFFEISFNHIPENLCEDCASFKIYLVPKEEYQLLITLKCLIELESYSKLSFSKALYLLKKHLADWEEESCKIYTSNTHFNQWLKRSFADIIMLTSNTPFGPYPYAGVPWFNTIFGRDGIITSLECLWINPQLAKGTLAYLSETQAKEFNPSQDAQPGKIVHEIRTGELAEIGEIPFARYYGSADATPLFVILAGKYFERTGDLDFIKKIWKNIVMAVEWMENFGDIDGDGLIEYEPSEIGLVNKGWKDSEDSVFYEDGSLARPPIALVEIQGYAYRAKKEAAKLARLLGEKDLAIKWEKSADKIKELIEEKYWCEEIKCYALALDGDKRPCKVRTSNAGHLLFTKAIPLSRAKELYGLFFEHHLFSGWGIRTLSSLEKRYNPLSYHNGSVWPHDNAIIGYGFSLYGLKYGTLKILEALFEASTFFKLHRIPELFCGFKRRPNEGPTHYPVACHPQAWAAGAVFLLLQGCLGLSFEDNKISFYHPLLPHFIEELWIKDLKFKDGKVDLYLKNYGEDVVINVVKKEGNIKIIIEK
ncbi:MAG: glycogen debranching N-terminal domain-containing protein [Caldimicrobium sp.]